MPYTVQFVGLVCFLRNNGGRKALLPDGRNPGDDIEPHDAAINVAPEAIEDAQGWPAPDASQPGVFRLDPCSISIEGAEDAGSLDTSNHDGRLPELRGIDPSFTIDLATAQTIARLDIRQGTLRAFRIPGGTAVISQLDVPHDGSIGITVTPADGGSQRTIRLRPGTEIAITNMGRRGSRNSSIEEENGHFRIYEKLSARPVSLSGPVTVPVSLSPSPSRHRFFGGIGPIDLSTSCSNTGCCTP
jgi:hypothetical protein